MKKSIFYLNLFLSFSFIFSQDISVTHRLFQTANLADLRKDSNFFIHLGQLLSQNNEPTTLLINGDLIKGDFGQRDSLEIRRLISLTRDINNGQLLIISGDRDWDDSGKKGLKQVKQLEKYIESFDNPKVHYALEKGCPGPQEIELTANVLLVLFNTQWWNHPYNKPGPQDGDCKIATTDIFKEELEDILDDNPNQHIIIAGHFPVFSLGEYGGQIPLIKHIFPLTDLNDGLYIPMPVLGSFYVAYRKNIGTSRDIINSNFLEIHEILEETITHHDGIIYLSGHEQNLQILQKENNYFINSGAPAKARYAAHDPDALISEQANGLIELIFYTDGHIESKVHLYSEKSGFKNQNSFTLYDKSLPEKKQAINPTTAFNRIISTSGNSAITIAGEEYEAGGIKRFFWGDHYRDTWTKEVSVPFLDLDTTFGGLTVYKKGGGRQTKSLKFKAANGQRYSFRSVNKDPTKALPYNLRETIAKDILKDQTTTQNPYGAMAADIMLNELDILHAHPKLYIMPDDERLGEFRTEFANMLGMLEENPATPKKNETAYKGANKIYRSHQMFRQLYKSHNNKVNTQEFIRARVFDLFVGDWGKHEDNWKWAAYKNEDDGWTFRPIPRDRDHVFSRWDGLIPYIADREWAKESGENFDYELTGIRSLMFQARHLDRYVATPAGRDDWITATEFIRQKITPEIIEKAVRNMPAETYSLSGKVIEDKLKARIKDLKKYAEEYYVMIADQVDIVGSAEDEYFDISRNKDNSVTVHMYPAKNGFARKEKLLYSRTFYPDETSEIRCFGLDGRDIFVVKGKSDDSILLRLIGGPGRDSYDDQSVVNGFSKKTIIYENSKKAPIHLGDEAVQNTSAEPQAYDYYRTAFAYDTYLPLPYISYNADDGLFFHLGYEIKTQAYEKRDYNILHNFALELASSGTFSLDYQIRFHHIFREWDLSTNGHWAQPGDVINFYGIGNNSFNNESKSNDFYKTRLFEKSISIGLIKEFWKQSVFNIYAHYLDNKPKKNTNSYLFQNAPVFGKEQINILSGSTELDLDFRDNDKLPRDGMRLFASYENGFIMNKNNKNYGRILSFIEHFSTVNIITPVTIGLKAGAAGSYGKVPYYKLFSLGPEDYLRGYRKNRFVGSKMVFFNSDLRLHLLYWHTSVVPVQIGIKGFFDSGKIVNDTINNRKWHNGWGIGFYFVPLEKDFTLNTSIGFSDEENGLFTIGIGTAFK